MAAAVRWPPLRAVWPDANAQLVAETQVRNLEEELRLEKHVHVSSLTLGLAEKVESRIISWRP